MNSVTPTALRILSGGAVQKGLETAAENFQKAYGCKVMLSFATAPVLRQKVDSKETVPDIIVAPLPTMLEFENTGCVIASSTTVIGSVKAGVAVRQGGWTPDISTAEALKRELIACESIVYNRGSSGIFVEKLIERLGIANLANAKTTRFPDAESVMNHIAGSQTEREIGFGQITAIVLHAQKSIKLVGPLPKEVESITTYAAGISTGAAMPRAAEQFITFLDSPAGKEIFKASGLQ